MTTERKKEFQRNTDLEHLLHEINHMLHPANEDLKRNAPENFTKLFVMGGLRSGTTLFMQWLAATGLVAYPTNMLSRFYGAPLAGAKIQQLLADPRYNFRNEIMDFTSSINFSSDNGKTRGALAPNEFWYFWRRFLPFTDLDYLPDAELAAQGNLAGLRDELNALANIFEKPFALKGMIVNQNIPAINALFGKALFVWVYRDPVFNIQSVLEARQRQFGTINTWYSFKIREYPQLKDLDPLQSAAGQIHAINHAIETAFRALPDERKLMVPYEDFCQQPATYHSAIVSKLSAQQGIHHGPHPYTGEARFDHTNVWRLKEYTQAQAEEAYRQCVTGAANSNGTPT